MASVKSAAAGDAATRGLLLLLEERESGVVVVAASGGTGNRAGIGQPPAISHQVMGSSDLQKTKEKKIKCNNNKNDYN